MTVCNMAIEGGARAGMVAPDETTFAYVLGKPKAPTGAAFDAARRYWETLPSDEGAQFDREVRLERRLAAQRQPLGPHRQVVRGAHPPESWSGTARRAGPS